MPKGNPMNGKELRKRKTKLQREYRTTRKPPNYPLSYSILGVRIGEAHRKVAERVLA